MSDIKYSTFKPIILILILIHAKTAALSTAKCV